MMNIFVWQVGHEDTSHHEHEEVSNVRVELEGAKLVINN